MGKGIEKDEEQGLELIRKAADQNHIYAMSELVDCYARGIGEPRNDQDDPMQILMRITQLRNGNSSEGYYQVKSAYRNIVFRYEYGVGTQSDIFAAADWYCRAALAGFDDFSIEDKLELGRPKWRPMQSYRGNAERGLISIVEPVAGGSSDRLLAALSCYLRAANGDSSASMQIGEQYATGHNVPANSVKAWLWFTQSVQQAGTNAFERVNWIEGRMLDDELNKARELLPERRIQLEKVKAFLRAVDINAHGFNPDKP